MRLGRLAGARSCRALWVAVKGLDFILGINWKLLAAIQWTAEVWCGGLLQAKMWPFWSGNRNRSPHHHSQPPLPLDFSPPRNVPREQLETEGHPASPCSGLSGFPAGSCHCLQEDARCGEGPSSSGLKDVQTDVGAGGSSAAPTGHSRCQKCFNQRPQVPPTCIFGESLL